MSIPFGGTDRLFDYTSKVEKILMFSMNVPGPGADKKDFSRIIKSPYDAVYQSTINMKILLSTIKSP